MYLFPILLPSDIREHYPSEFNASGLPFSPWRSWSWTKQPASYISSFSLKLFTQTGNFPYCFSELVGTNCCWYYSLRGSWIEFWCVNQINSQISMAQPLGGMTLYVSNDHSTHIASTVTCAHFSSIFSLFFVRVSMYQGVFCILNLPHLELSKTYQLSTPVTLVKYG